MMHTHTSWMARALALAGLTVAIAVAPAAAQTPEGTIIINMATVNWQDANGFVYDPVNGSVSVTVGFQAGLSLTPDGGSQSPASPSTGGTMALTVQNVGNGTDQVQVAESITGDPTVISVTNYNFNAVDYGTDFAALNTALALFDLTAGASTVITVTYSVGSGKGGLSANYQLTASSVRTPAVTNPGDYDITPGETFAVAVTPDGAQNLQQLPSGSNYTFTFTVQNNGNGPEDFDLLARPGVPGPVITILFVNAVPGDSTRITALAAGASTTIDVIYSVGDVSAGTQDSVYLKARSLANPATLDEGFADLTVIRAIVTITKQAWLDDQSAEISANVLPGQFIQYKITVTNTGAAAASSVVVTDVLASLPVTYISNSDPVASWSSITESAGTVTATLSGTLAASGGTAYFWIRVQIN